MPGDEVSIHVVSPNKLPCKEPLTRYHEGPYKVEDNAIGLQRVLIQG